MIRQQFGLSETDLLIVQPTSLAERKAPETSLHFAQQLQLETGRHALMLYTAADNIDMISRLIRLSREVGVDCQFDGLNTRHFNNANRIGDLLITADFTSMPSYEDDVMLALAEAAYIRQNIFTRAYVDGEGAPVFDSVYGPLDALVQGDMEVMPDPQLVKKAGQIIHGQLRLDLEGNANFVKNNLTGQGIAPLLVTLNETF